MSASSYPDFWRTHERRSGTPSRRATDLDGWVASAEEIERAAAEEERRRLARELHDGVLNSLTGTSLQLHATSRLIEQDPAAARQRLREIERLVTEQQTELRAFIQQMRDGVEPSRPAHANLLIALKGLCRRASGCGPLVDLTGSDFALIPDSLVDHVYRLVEELVSNSVRHAHADFIWVEVRRWRHDVVVSVASTSVLQASKSAWDCCMDKWSSIRGVPARASRFACRCNAQRSVLRARRARNAARVVASCS